MTTYRTIDLARAAGVHVNTVRFYERIGLLSPVSRAKNGYRLFTERHLLQISVCRNIYEYGWLGKELRQASLAIIHALREWDLSNATAAATAYQGMLTREWQAARHTADILERWAARQVPAPHGATYSRRQVATELGVTEEVLRNWERNGLIRVPRSGPNRARVYSQYEVERLRIIYLLRQTNFSMAAIHASLHQYDLGHHEGVISALHRPVPQPDASWIAVGDHWIASLERALDGADKIFRLLHEATDADKK